MTTRTVERHLQRVRGLSSRLMRCTDCGAELKRFAFVLHRVPPELAELVDGAKCVPRAAFASLGIERFDDEHDRWSSTPGGVARAYQAALDDLAEGRLTAWQRMNFDRLRLRS